MDAGLQTVLVVIASIAAAMWMLNVAGTALLLRAAREAGDDEATVQRARRHARMGWTIGIPAAIIVAVAGTYYVIDRNLTIESNWWIGTAIGCWLVAFFGSTMTRGSQLGAAAKLAERDGPGDEDVQWRIRRVDLTARGEAMLLVVAAVVVALQPTAAL